LAEQSGLAHDMPTPLAEGHARQISDSDSQDGYQYDSRDCAITSNLLAVISLELITTCNSIRPHH